MKPIDILLIIIIALIVAGVLLYIRREKKKGSKCIGCPYGKSCSGKCDKKSE